ERLVTRIGSPAQVLELARSSGGAAAIRAATRSPDGEWSTLPRAVAEGIVEATGAADQILADVRRLGLRLVAAADPDFPRRLRTIDIPPPALFVRGDVAPLAADAVVAVVGTRRPSEAGRRVASRIAAALTRAGATVVSGLAVGIDGAAHAAVVAEGGRTVAFIGGGHGRLFPRAHARLAGAIVEAGGAVVSEYAPGTEPTKGTFPQRNRLISGSSDAVVVVEAGARSGALLTASWALEQGRECFVVPGPIDALASAGCLGFLRDWHGAARIVAGVPQLLDDLGLPAGAALRPVLPTGPGGTIVSASVAPSSVAALLVEADPAQHAVAVAMLRGATTIDELVAVTGLTVAAVLGAVTRLESRGLVDGAQGRYRVVGRLAAAPAPAA
ncbi:MAG TPA: DNA-processing protein DprA, partial [Candidatus Deferrimicrobiaceae bacterium]|nr:DNA-processing protein DprA [Candidatus Deferrimicrobiaceae bacterium]